MKLMTKVLEHKLREQGEKAAEDGDGATLFPLVKFFDPFGASTWLISEITSSPGEPIMMFGLCDLGQGFPELGYVSLDELESVQIGGRTRINRDLYWKGDKTLKEYTEDADKEGRIVS